MRQSHFPENRHQRQPVVLVEHLSKSYGSTHAVRDVSFTVERGEVFSLLGPNGAGKTTIVEILEGFRDRTAGVVEVSGLDPKGASAQLRQKIGLMLQSTAIEPQLTVREALSYYGCGYEQRRETSSLLELVGLSEKSNSRLSTLSGGQRRLFDLALALIGEPEILFLDEPTTGFDPRARRTTWNVLRGLRDQGTTIILTTHYMEEAEALASRVAILLQGSMVAAGQPSELIARPAEYVAIRFRMGGAECEELPPELLRHASYEEDGRLAIKTTDATQALCELTTWALTRGVRLDQLSASPGSLEDAFLHLTSDVSSNVLNTEISK